MQITPKRSYRCFFTPVDRFGAPDLCESGVQPFVQLQEADAERAQRAAHHVTGCPITGVERLDDVATA